MRKIGREKFSIQLLEEFPYTSADQTRLVERKYAELLSSGLEEPHSDSETDIRAQISALKTQIERLESKLEGSLSSSVP
jgi:hypothetical protein